MVIDQIKKIDQNADNQIDGKELVDALKPNGFFSTEDNLIKVGNLLNSKDIQQSDQELFSSLEQSFYTLKNQIIQKEDITDEDVNILNAYMKILGGKCEDECREIQKVINRHNIQKIMLKNHVSEEDILMLQDYMSKLDDDQEKISEIQNFIEWHDIQKIMQEYKNKSNMTGNEKEELITYLEKITGENYDSKDLDTQKKIDEVNKFLSQQNDVIQRINDVYKTLDQNEQNLLTSILGPGNKDLIENIDNFLSGDIQLNTESVIKGVNVLNKLIEHDLYRHGKLENIVNKSLMDISHEANKKIASPETGNKNRYSDTEIMAIQLWANVCYGEKLIINGIRGGDVYRPIKDISSEEGITSTYIYRLELMTRSDIITIRHNNINTKVDYLLDIPNLHDMLDLIQPKEKQDEIWQDFLNTVYLPIRQGGIYFENKITGKKLSNLLQNMINAEVFKDQPIYETIFALVLSKSRMDENSEEYNNCKSMIESLKKAQLNNIHTMGDYYSELVKQEKEQIKGEHLSNKGNNEIQRITNMLSKIITQIDGLPKLKDNPTESEISQFKINYKKEYEKIAKNFINLWRNEKYKKYLESSTLTTQIFIEIYSLWKDDGIDKIFGPDIKQSVDDVINQLNGFTDVENNEIEKICDLYHNTMGAEANIGQGNSERIEDHHTDVIRTYDYYGSIDNTATNVGSTRSAGYVEITTTVHHDNYFGNGYSEYHETATRRKESPSPRNPEGSDEILVNHNPNGTLVGPDKDGWYAILPKDLKEKSNKGQIKLAIIMGKPCVYEFMENGDIKYWVYDKEKKQLVFDKTMTQSEYSRALTIESSRAKIWEADNLEEFQTIQKELEKITGKQKDVENLFNERKNKDLDNIELEDLQGCSIRLYNMAERFIKNPEIGKNLVKLKKSLQKLNQNTNNYQNPFEEQIEWRIKSIDNILDFINPSNKNLEKIKDFRDFCLHGIDSNNTNRKRFKEYVPMILSFIAAIAITVASYGSLSTLTIAIISAGAGIAVHDISQGLLVSRNGTINVDGKEYSTSYQLTLAQQAYNGEITYQDAIKQYAIEWGKAAALQYLLVTIGGRASSRISTILAKAKPGSFCDRAGKAICNVLCKENVSKDMYTEGIIKSIGKQAGKEGFLKRFGKELLEESFEESVENVAGDISPSLGAVATFVHCLKPKPGLALNNAGVSYNPTIDIPEGGNKLLIKSTYDGTDPDNMEKIQKYYEGIKGYKVSILDGNVLKVTTEGVTYTDELGKTTTLIDSSKEVELEFRPSKAPLSIRNISTKLLEIGGINIDDQTGNITYKSKTDLLMLSEYYRQNNLGIIKINPDGTAMIITNKETIHLNKSSDYYDIEEEQVRSNSKAMDKILENLENLSNEDGISIDINGEKVGKLLDQLKNLINKQYRELTGSTENLDLNTEQLISILATHAQDRSLWGLITGQSKTLDETITDPDVMRFLFEAGFCGVQQNLETSNVDTKQETQQITGHQESSNEGSNNAEKTEEHGTDPQNNENSLFDTNKGKENITQLGEEISSLEKQIAEKGNEISNLEEGNPHKAELEKEKKDLEKQLKKSKKRKESLQIAIDTVEQWNSQYDPEVLQSQIDAKKEKLSTMDKTSKEYKELEKEIKNLEKKQKSGIHETLVNGEKLIQKTSTREILVLKLKKLKFELKNLYYNITNNTAKIEETKLEIKNIEKEIHTLDNDIAKIIETTYQGLRNLKGLDDTELRELTRTYYINILKPIQFILINPSQTFESDIVNSEFSTQRDVSIEGKFEGNLSKIGGIREKITNIRLGNYAALKTMSDISTFIEENFGEGTAEKQILLNLKKSLEENIGLDDKRLSEADRVVIFLNGVSYMLDYNEAYPDSSPQNIYNILDTNQNKLIHQHTQDKHYLTGSSHDVLHILRGNMNMAENYMGNMSARERVITRQIIIDHDMGYTSVFNKFLSSIRSDVFFDATKDHPLWSSQFIEDNAQRYIDNFGYDEYNIIKDSVTGHSKPDTVSLPTETNTSEKPRYKQINAVISVVDCVAASADYKSAFLFSQPQIAGEFLSVYMSMNEGNIGNAVDGLHNIIRTANSIPDPNLKEAICDALNSLHLTDPATGGITLDKKVESIDEMPDSDVNEAKDKLISKLHDSEKSKKTLSIFCKANGISDPSIVTDDNITPEQVKNYLKFDYINDRVSFPYEKYLSQYGVRVSVDSEGNTMIGESGGIVTATFELAGDSFETLLNVGKDNYDFKGKTVADFALASFLKVCDDMNIDIKDDENINILKNHINNRVKNGNGKTIAEYLTEQYGKGFIVLTGKKGEKITLKFDGKSYEGFNRVVTEIFKINNELDESIDILKNNPETRQSEIPGIQSKLNNLGNLLSETPGINIDREGWRMIVDNINSLQETNGSIEKAIESINSLRKYYRFTMENI